MRFHKIYIENPRVKESTSTNPLNYLLYQVWSNQMCR